MKTKILIAYVHDKPGVLTKIASIFYRRHMNIHTLTVGRTATSEVSKIVFRVAGSDAELNRLMLSVDNLVDVITVDVQEDSQETARELCLVRLACDRRDVEEEIMSSLQPFAPRLWRREKDSIVLEIVDSPQRIDAFIATLMDFNLIDLSRTGATAIPAQETVKEAIGYETDNVTSMMQRKHQHF